MPIRLEGGSRVGTNALITSPLVSIITVVFNARAVLPELLDSVLKLKNSHTELIVVDGGSKDGTVEFLQQHNSSIEYWLSEPDYGIYDAMNKAIAHARGTFLLHLNAGDKLLKIPMEELQVAKEEGLDIVAFRVSLDGRSEFQPRYSVALRFNNTLHHQGTFFRREMFPTYDIAYKIFADFDVNQCLLRSGAQAKIFDAVVALHATDGVSNMRTSAAATEFFQIIAKNYGRRWLPVAWVMCKWRGLMARLRPLTVNRRPSI
jgi:glycosyltransferase involved in cell wall biosynthesis